jgi:hypothetical protein
MLHKRALVVGMVLAVLLALGSRGWAAPPLQARAVVTYPTDGMTIGGVVEITGIATHPNIQWYDVSYAAGAQATGGSQWVSLALVENTQVENGVLATWDTTGLPAGQYSLALTVVGRDDPFTYQQIVTRLTVNNAQLAPEATQEQATPEPLPTAVTGPTPTPVTVEQPATATPRPSPTAEAGGGEDVTPSAVGEEGSSVPFSMGELRGAFCNGGLITVMLFLLGGLYMLAKATIRWYLRHNKQMPWD